MPSIFIEPTTSEGWSIEQHHAAAAMHPIIRAWLTAQMRNQPACDIFYDTQRAITRIRHIDPAEWQDVVRVPVVKRLGIKFDGEDAARQYSAVYHLLGAATCLNWSFPAARVETPAVTQAIEQETRQLVEYLVTLGIKEQELPGLLELCRRV